MAHGGSGDTEGTMSAKTGKAATSKGTAVETTELIFFEKHDS